MATKLLCCYLPAIVILVVIVTWLLRKLTVGNYKDKYVFITGCDTGFGNMLAKRLDSLGFHVFAGCFTEMGENDLRKSCSGNLIPVDLDITKEPSINKAVEYVNKSLPKGHGLWALVNNAGIAGEAAPTEWLTKADYDQVLSVNLYGPILVTKAFLPLIRNTPGRIVNVTSIMGRIALGHSQYVVSKFGMEGFSDALRYELITTGATVHVVEPGCFRTGIIEEGSVGRSMRAKFAKLDDEAKEYYGAEYIETFETMSNRMLSVCLSSRTDYVVDAYVHAVTARFPKTRYVVGWDAMFLFRPLWSLPDWVTDFIVRFTFPTPRGAQTVIEGKRL